MNEELSYTDEKHSDANLNVTFFKAVTEEGLEVDYVRVAIPGNTATIVEEPVNEHYKRRFKAQWDAYNNLKELTGTPIESWDDCPEAMRREFKKLEFNFVEQVANAPDNLLLSVMGGPTWRAKAKAYLDKFRITPEKIITAQQAQIEDLQAQIAELAAMMGTAKRGRPAKED